MSSSGLLAKHYRTSLTLKREIEIINRAQTSEGVSALERYYDSLLPCGNFCQFSMEWWLNYDRRLLSECIRIFYIEISIHAILSYLGMHPSHVTRDWCFVMRNKFELRDRGVGTSIQRTVGVIYELSAVVVNGK